MDMSYIMLKDLRSVITDTLIGVYTKKIKVVENY